MPEAVRLVVWDLDETFWRGTVTEGGITEYVQAHHDIVIELARRGIMSSICSKNDEAVILPILERYGIRDYFVFPSISWEPKGMRLAALVEAVQLRAATVMFIDDNPGNRAEARAVVPDLQVEDETFIPRLLADPRFKGKDDKDLTRLAQYKLLETRKKDEAAAAGDNAAFLRGCDIRVYIEYDVLAHLDRAIELINRTNQLNFTKKRLPEDMAEARRILTQQVSDWRCNAGLIRVMDRYGDYGFVGFFLALRGRTDADSVLSPFTLVHYCFSCRTLGMLVEQWAYNWLRQPELKVVGEVLTDLTTERNIDWIRLVTSIDDDAAKVAAIAPEIRVHGGCEANAIAHYLTAHSPAIKVTGNFAVGGLFVRVNSAPLMLSGIDHAGPAFAAECERLGLPYNLMVNPYFDEVPYGTLFVFSGALDAAMGSPCYRHSTHGWEFKLEPNGLSLLNLVNSDQAEIERQLQTMRYAPATHQQILSTVSHLRTNYSSFGGVNAGKLAESMRSLFERVPVGSKMVLILDDERGRGEGGTVKMLPWVANYNRAIKEIASAAPFVSVVQFSDVIRSEDEIQFGGNHYDRMVYCRLADLIIEAAARTTVKPKQTGMAA